MLEALWEHAIGMGYLGALIFGFLGNIVPFFPVPYLLQVIVLATFLDPLPLSVLSAFGATVAKLFIVGSARGISRRTGYMKKESIVPLRAVLNRYGWIAVFIASVTPVSDDAILIPSALAGMSISRFFLPILVGKFLLSYAVATGSKWVLDIVEERVLTPTELAVGLSASVLFMIALIYLIYKVNWTKLLPGELRKFEQSAR